MAAPATQAPSGASSKARSTAATDADLRATFERVVLPFVKANCISCHGEKKKGGLDMGPYKSLDAAAADLDKWDIILEQIESDQMPPEDAQPQPSAAERSAVAAFIRAFSLHEAARGAGDPGVVLPHRLSNAEYDNTIRDLTGVDLRPTEQFPVDPANPAGFDNSGESLRMSPGLFQKYLETGHRIAEHVVFDPDGLSFSAHPAVQDIDRDHVAVHRILDFYARQPTDLAGYFKALARYRARAKLGKARASLNDFAKEQSVSPRYLATIDALLSRRGEARGPVAALQAMFRMLPSPVRQPNELDAECAKLRDIVTSWRHATRPKVPSMHVRGVNDGAQWMVLWKDRQLAATRSAIGQEISKIDASALGGGPVALRLLAVPKGKHAQDRYSETWARFATVFPDTFYVTERARVYKEGEEFQKENERNAGRLLSAGFHHQVGFFRDDEPLVRLVLDEASRREIADLWSALDVVTGAPLRQLSTFVWYERAEPSDNKNHALGGFLQDAEFDRFRAEDADIGSPANVAALSQAYQAKLARLTDDPVALAAAGEYFVGIEAAVRRVERARTAAEPSHLRALQRFAERASRRRMSAKEQEEILAVYRDLRTREGRTHEGAIRDAIATVLVSPAFLYRQDGPARAAKGFVALSDYALANRLSYFLWASMPDAELLDLAAAGRLHEPDVLAAQVRRMVADARMAGFVKEFVGNWLDFRRFERNVAVDRERFTAFDDTLRRSMFEEPLRFVEDLIRRDGAVQDLILGSHTIVNGPLARLYGMPAPSPNAGDWAVVPDADRYGRGGLLAMSVFLTKNAAGLRTSPVRRGHWLVTRVLGERIPPPPAQVPELPKDETKLGALTLREALLKHRESSACAGCHARIDYYGLGFEGYDPIGVRRDVDSAGRTIDASVTFPGGSTGEGLVGLKKFLRDHRADAFVENFIGKLVSYALGRTLISSDALLIAKLREAMTTDGGRIGNVITGIVLSPQFRNRRGDRP